MAGIKSHGIKKNNQYLRIKIGKENLPNADLGVCC